jgi:hypothetical protein
MVVFGKKACEAPIESFPFKRNPTNGIRVNSLPSSIQDIIRQEYDGELQAYISVGRSRNVLTNGGICESEFLGTCEDPTPITPSEKAVVSSLWRNPKLEFYIRFKELTQDIEAIEGCINSEQIAKDLILSFLEIKALVDNRIVPCSKGNFYIKRLNRLKKLLASKMRHLLVVSSPELGSEIRKCAMQF